MLSDSRIEKIDELISKSLNEDAISQKVGVVTDLLLRTLNHYLLGRRTECR